MWARGYPNYYKHNVSFLEGITETFWLHSTFTYNIRLIDKNTPVRFEKGEPLMFLTCINLKELNNSTLVYKYIENDKVLHEQYNKWNISRKEFNSNKERKPEDWQKDYFKGQKADNSMTTNHLTTIKLNIDNNSV
jgi:hypothetical protein